MVSSYTLGTTVEFGERVRAAAGAGFDGIGLRAENYWAAGLDDAAMLAIAKQHGVRILEVEYLTGWGTAADRDEAQQAKERTVFHMARAFGVRHVNAGLLEKLPPDAGEDEFAALCERGHRPDGRAGVHALQRRPRPRDGLADRGGGEERGLIVDGWHWARAGQKVADLYDVPAERIVSVQLCDVRTEPMKPLRAESLGHRLPPGKGSGDTVGMVRALTEHGVTLAVMTVEVISDELVARGVNIAAQVPADAAREVLASV